MDIHDQDAVKLRLRTLTLANWDALASAGQRLTGRTEQLAQAATDRKRAGVETELRAYESARSHVLEGAQPFAEDQDRSRDGELLRDWYGAFSRLASEGTDLASMSALDAHIQHYVARYLEGAREAGVDGLTPEGLEAERRAELDPERVTVATNRPAFLLCDVLREWMSEPEDEQRTHENWWEVACLVLCVECLDFSPSFLGLPADLPVGGWDQIGDDVFGHRDGMRCYLDREEGSGGKEVRDAQFWMLARRAADHLDDNREGPTVRVRTQPCLPEPQLSDAEANWFQDKGKFFRVRYREKEAGLRTLNGLKYIRLLIMKSPKGVRVEDLIAASGGQAVVSHCQEQELETDARRRFKEKLARLDEDRARAEESGSALELEEVRADQAAIRSELSRFRATAQDANKRNCQLVGHGIKTAIKEIRGEQLSDLAVHLERSIRTPSGREPRYDPREDEAVEWVV